MSTVDVAIVGAGFAGLACARAAALAGLSVVVLERGASPGARIATTGIVVKEAAEAFDLPAAPTRRIARVRLHAPSLAARELEAPGYWFLATDTRALLAWLAGEAARAGATLRFAAPFAGADDDGTRVRLDGHGIAARWLVGADGARSAVAAAFGLARNRRFLVGVEAHWPIPPGFDAGALHCFLDPRLAPGYLGWAVAGPHALQVGVAAERDAGVALAPFVARVRPLLGGLAGDPLERRAGPIPVGGPLREVARGRVLLVGDAAGWVSPLTGGGIHRALDAGRRAGRAIAERLRFGGPPPAEALAAAAPRVGFKRLLRLGMALPPPAWSLELLVRAAPLARIGARVFFHRAAARNRAVRD